MLPPSRRHFLSVAASVLADSFLRAVRVRAQSATAPADLFDLRQAAEGVYLALARPAALLNCNGAIFVNSRDVLIVDAHSKPAAVAALVAQIRRDLTAKPVRYIVNTHFHWDHTQGMPAYRTLAPDAQVLATSTTRRLIEELGARRAKAMVESRRAELDALRQRRSVAPTYYDRMIAETEAFVREMENYQPELPDVTFDESLVLHDRGHELHLVFRGRAHTASDISVWCPQKRVIATGDLLTGFVPGLGDGFPAEYPATLRRLGELGWTRVLPGHGDLQEGRRRLDQMVAYFEELNQIVSRGKKAGKSLEQLQKEITPATLRSLAQSDYGAYLAESHARFELAPPGVTGAAIVANRVRGNVAEVYHAL
jgi:glyoxylase-like metal-dependent hydrolase (beta-lactamase superfamily II)